MDGRKLREWNTSSHPITLIQRTASSLFRDGPETQGGLIFN
jgi:hypothetical protein